MIFNSNSNCVSTSVARRHRCWGRQLLTVTARKYYCINVDTNKQRLHKASPLFLPVQYYNTIKTKYKYDVNLERDYIYKYYGICIFGRHAAIRNWRENSLFCLYLLDLVYIDHELLYSRDFKRWGCSGTSLSQNAVGWCLSRGSLCWWVADSYFHFF